MLPITGGIDDENRITSINYTSGTTGRPKGVMYTHRGAAINALGEVIVHGLERDSVYLWTLPLFHCNGWCFPWAVTAAGGTHVMLRAIEPGRVIRLIQSERVTHFNGAPTVLIMLAEAPEAQGVRFDPPVRVATGGSPPSPTLLARMEELGVRVIHLYGLTETYGPHVYCELQPGWERLDVEKRAAVMARQGVPYHVATHLRVVDGEMRDVPADAQTMGEVVMRGNNVMAGYFDDPEATAKAFEGGWFHSGDLGVMHPDGYIELRDRKKDIIISGGENISTIEVEHTIVKHPAVLECAVVAMPHEKWGEVPKAFVALRPGQQRDRGRADRVLPRAARALQVPEGGRVRRSAEDVDRQDPEVPAAREGVGGAREPDLVGERRMLESERGLWLRGAVWLSLAPAVLTLLVYVAIPWIEPSVAERVRTPIGSQHRLRVGDVLHRDLPARRPCTGSSARRSAPTESGSAAMRCRCSRSGSARCCSARSDSGARSVPVGMILLVGGVIVRVAGCWCDGSLVSPARHCDRAHARGDRRRLRTADTGADWRTDGATARGRAERHLDHVVASHGPRWRRRDRRRRGDARVSRGGQGGRARQLQSLLCDRGGLG